MVHAHLRSPGDTLGGLVHLPRMLDKIRAHARGELPDAYRPLLGNGFDGYLCRLLELDHGALAAAVRSDGLNDEEALAWCRRHGRWPDEETRLIFNAFLRKRGWRDELAPRLRQMVEEMTLDDEGSLMTAFEVIDADEGRWPAAAPLEEGPVRERVRLMQQHLRPLAPLPASETPVLPRLSGIRAVVFDLYGTLFISGTGDISLAENEDRDPLLRAALEEAGVVGLPSGLPLARRLHAAIRVAQDQRRASGIEYPEVEIREVWHHFLADLAADGFVFDQPDAEGLSRLAIDYECRVNPVWPMPDLSPTLAVLREQGFHLGIVSNAQFYSRLMFPALLGSSLRELGFAPDSCVFSYREREGKPSTALFETLRQALEGHGIAPAETLYVGNDLRNDIWPAQQLGLRTALFAGDARSLRWRRDDPRLEAVRPDAILTGLWQICGILPG